MSDLLQNIFILIIVVILSIATIRDLITRFFAIPKNKWYSEFFHKQYDKELLIDVFKELGIDKKKVEDCITEIQVNDIKSVQYDVKLLELISKYIYYTKKPLIFGEDSSVETNYYISTMEASHNNEDSKLMYEIIYKLVRKKLDFFPDFILTPKAGNPLLGRRFANTYEKISIFGKSSTEKSLAKIDEFDYKNRLLINFEGSVSLLNKAKEKYQDSKLKGVIIDCNTSSGKQIIGVMNTFNDLINKLNAGEKINIEPIKNAFVLFVITDEKNNIDIDKNFTDNKCLFYRYFDLQEESKKEIYEYKNKIKKDLNYYNNRDKKFIDKFIYKLKEQNNYKFN